MHAGSVRKTGWRTRLLTNRCRNPAPSPYSSPAFEYRTSMNSRRSKRGQKKIEAAHKDACGARRCPAAAIGLDLRPDVRWPEPEVPRNEGDNRRRSLGTDKGENRILGGSDPTLSGLAAAQRPRRRGAAPPNLSSGVPPPVAGDLAGQ